MLNVERTPQGVDKVKRYKWKVADRPGQFKEIAKGLLEIDPQYQREQNEVKVGSIAGNWSYIACGVIPVAQRDGRYFALDGGHRIAAAKRRSDIATLPCMVWKLDGIEDEATFFLIINTLRKAMTSAERFKAELTRGNETALFLQNLLTQSGRVISKGENNSARAVTALMRAASDSRAAFSRIYPVMDEICRGRALHNHLVRALIYVEEHMPEGETLTSARWRHRLISIGYEGLIDVMNKAAGFRGKTGEKVWGEGVVERINRGLQKNRLALD